MRKRWRNYISNRRHRTINLTIQQNLADLEVRVLAAGMAMVDDAALLPRRHPLRFPLLYSSTGRFRCDRPNFIEVDKS